MNQEAKSIEAKSELQLSSKLYQKAFLKFLAKNGGDPSFPWVVELDPTTACNLACPDCISGKLLGNGGFTRERLISLVDELIENGVKAVVLIGGGEPMMHPAIETVINKLGQAGIAIGITTNGLFLKRYKDCILNYASWVRISVDAASDGLFSVVRPDHKGNSRLSEVLDNIKSLTSENQRNTVIGFSYCMLPIPQGTHSVYSTNCYEIYSAAALAKEIGCDYFELKPSFDEDHYHFIHPIEDILKAKQEFSEAHELQTNNFTVYGATNMQTALDANTKTQPKDYNSCQTLKYRTLITPHGVYPCPYFRGKSEKSYGTVEHTSFGDLWRSSKVKTLRSSIVPCNDCKFHCIRHETNLHLDKLSSMAKDGTLDLDKLSVPDYNLFI